MRVHVSVCYLLVCTTLGLLAGADPIGTQKLLNIEENEVEYNNNNNNNNDNKDNIIEEEMRKETMRLKQEYKFFKKGLMMENDEGELVELTLDDIPQTIENVQAARGILENSVSFRLYTRKNPHNYQSLRLNDKKNLAASNFNADKPTHFVTHGWINSGNSPACTLIRDAYLKNDDFNVIVVDWSKITLRPYMWAASRVLMVGKYVAKMIDFLETHARLDPGKTTLAGHSLGAHVMGLAGYYSKGTINYIVGLDPALPLFLLAGVGSRISTQDANHVQIIHTNAGLLGYLSEIGHSDFYPNGGSKQAGCLVDIGGACSHARSYKFFAESINSQIGFYGKKCKTFLSFMLGTCKNQENALMGGPLINFSNTGKYFLSTKPREPFAKANDFFRDPYRLI